MNEMRIAINQTKQALRSMNFSFLIGGSLVISIMGTMMVLGYHPENLTLGFIPIFWFIMKGFIAISVLMVSCLIIVVFVDTYQSRILKNYNDKRNYLLSIIGIFKIAPDIIKEHTYSNEYKNMLFENLLKSEKPSIWKWFGEIFVQIQKHITNQKEINEEVASKLKEHDDLITKISKGTNLSQSVQQKQLVNIIDDISFQTIRQEKLDEFQTRLDEFVQ